MTNRASAEELARPETMLVLSKAAKPRAGTGAEPGSKSRDPNGLDYMAVEPRRMGVA